MLKIAYFSPLPPAQTGIADYSAELLPELAQLAAVTLFADESDSEIARRFDLPLYPTMSFPQRQFEFDCAVYQVGNSLYHDQQYDIAVQFGGIVVLHDYNLHHFIAERSIGRGRFGRFMREMAYDYGVNGVQTALEIQAGMCAHEPEQLPLNRRLLDSSLGVIVHSQSVQAQIQQKSPLLSVAHIPAVMTPISETHSGAAATYRRQLELTPDTVLFVSAGQITSSKQIDFALRAFAQLRELVKHPIHYAVVGGGDHTVYKALAAELGLSAFVTWVGYVPDIRDFNSWIYAADVVINLRYPTMGETSAVALRALAAARPVIVFEHGTYQELPLEATWQVKPMDMDGLVEALIAALASGERQRRGAAGRHAIEHTHRAAVVAARYIQFIQQFIQNIIA